MEQSLILRYCTQQRIFSFREEKRHLSRREKNWYHMEKNFDLWFIVISNLSGIFLLSNYNIGKKMLQFDKKYFWKVSMIISNKSTMASCHFLSKNSNNLTYKRCQKFIKSMKNTSNIHNSWKRTIFTLQMSKKHVFKVGLKTVIFSIFTGFSAKNDTYCGNT